MAGVFDGLTVLDLSWGIAGPITTMLLADNGADVIRIERPAGDPFAAQSGYTVWQRGKRNAVLDLARRRATATRSSRSPARADVVVESFAPGTTARLGIDHAALVGDEPAARSRCSITGYGRDNRHSDRPGYDALVAARTGLFFDQKGRRGAAMEYILGRPGPHPEFDAPEGMVRGADRPGPVFPRSTWPSLGAAFLATLGVAAALRAREVTGRGQWVETSLLQGALAAVALNWQRVENPDAPLYWMWPVDSRSIEGLFECSDGRWVHHWTVRPNWVLSVSEGDELAVPDVDHKYRDDPDRIGMEADDLLVGELPVPDARRDVPPVPVGRVVRHRRASRRWAWRSSAARARRWPTRRSSPTAASSSSTTPSTGASATSATSSSSRRRPGGVQGPVAGRGEHTEEVRTAARDASAGAPASTSAASGPPAAPPRHLRSRACACRPRPRGRGSVRTQDARRPRCRRDQGARAARHVLGRDPHGAGHEPRQAQHLRQPEGPARQRDPAPAGRPRRRARDELAPRCRGAPRDRRGVTA